MSKTPRTDASQRIVLDGPGEPWKVVQADFARRLESDLGDCLATLKMVRDYLNECHCQCYHGTDYHCARCRMRADVETTIKNTKS